MYVDTLRRFFDVVRIKGSEAASTRAVLMLGGIGDKVGKQLGKFRFAFVVLPALGVGFEL